MFQNTVWHYCIIYNNCKIDEGSCYLHCVIQMFLCYCVVPETNQNHPEPEGCLGREGLKSQKESTDLNEFSEGRGGGGKLNREMLCGEGYGYFCWFSTLLRFNNINKIILGLVLLTTYVSCSKAKKCAIKVCIYHF